MTIATVILEARAGDEGYPWANLAILVIVALLVVPVYRRLRDRLSRDRRERWAREDEDYRRGVEQRDVG